MFQGQLLAIHIGSRKGHALQAVSTAHAVAGRGLEGDRHFRPEGSGRPDQEVTLIEVEALEGLTREKDIPLEPHQARRNLLTRGVPLNHLVGRTFLVGDVLLRGIRLCEPCSHLEKLTRRGVEKGLCHRGGLRAEIVRGGVLNTGDLVRPAD